jgi:hypothetical protein
MRGKKMCESKMSVTRIYVSQMSDTTVQYLSAKCLSTKCPLAKTLYTFVQI